MIEYGLAAVGVVGLADVLFFGGQIGVKVAALVKTSAGVQAVLAKIKAAL